MVEKSCCHGSSSVHLIKSTDVVVEKDDSGIFLQVRLTESIKTNEIKEKEKPNEIKKRNRTRSRGGCRGSDTNCKCAGLLSMSKMLEVVIERLVKTLKVKVLKHWSRLHN